MKNSFLPPPPSPLKFAFFIDFCKKRSSAKNIQIFDISHYNFGSFLSGLWGGGRSGLLENIIELILRNVLIEWEDCDQVKPQNF